MNWVQVTLKPNTSIGAVDRQGWINLHHVVHVYRVKGDVATQITYQAGQRLQHLRVEEKPEEILP